jgi:hypothetical protein
MRIAPYWKTVAAAVAAGAIAVQAALSDSTITTAEWVTIGLAVLGALGVYAAKNQP